MDDKQKQRSNIVWANEISCMMIDRHFQNKFENSKLSTGAHRRPDMLGQT